MFMKILVVEDEQKILKFLERGFKEQGYAVDCAADGQEGYFLATGEIYDCMVLDVMLPKLNGYEIVEKVRKKKISTPVIFLTAKDAVEDRVKGLEIGADDYIVKPFAFSELLARVRAQVRRRGGDHSEELTLGSLKIDLKKRNAWRNGSKIDLTPKEFAMLQFFIERQGEVVTRTMLAENIWGYHFDSMTNVIDVHINNLRKKIDTSDRSLIQTRRGIGYVFGDPES